MSWSPAVNEFVLRLADDDAAVRDAALEEALGLNEADLTLVSSIDQHLSSWRASGRLQRHGGRLTIGVPTRIVDDTVTRLVAVLRPHVLGLYDVVPTEPRPRVLPAGWGHAGLVTLSTTWPLGSVEGLGGLTWLNMDNRLESLPEELGDPPSLLLGHNPLRQLPIAQLMAMRRLDFLVVDEDAPLDEASQTWLRELYRNKPRLEYINDDPDADDDDPRHDPH